MLIPFVWKPKHTTKYAMLYNDFIANSIKQDVLFKNLTFFTHSFVIVLIITLIPHKYRIWIGIDFA